MPEEQPKYWLMHYGELGDLELHSSWNNLKHPTLQRLISMMDGYQLVEVKILKEQRPSDWDREDYV